MDLKEVKKLIDLVEKSGVSHLSVEEGGTKIEIKKELSAQNITVPIQANPAPIAAAPAIEAASPAKEDNSAENNSNLTEIKAQMVGTFYASASPDSAPYIKVGDSISDGQVLCIIEAMKLFNEIESEISGKIEKICVSNGDSIEFGQTLFLVQQG